MPREKQHNKNFKFLKILEDTLSLDSLWIEKDKPYPERYEKNLEYLLPLYEPDIEKVKKNYKRTKKWVKDSDFTIKPDENELEEISSL